MFKLTSNQRLCVALTCDRCIQHFHMVFKYTSIKTHTEQWKDVFAHKSVYIIQNHIKENTSISALMCQINNIKIIDSQITHIIKTKLQWFSVISWRWTVLTINNYFTCDLFITQKTEKYCYLLFGVLSNLKISTICIFLQDFRKPLLEGRLSDILF